MDLSSEAADANAAAGFELLAETFYKVLRQRSCFDGTTQDNNYSIIGKARLYKARGFA